MPKADDNTELYVQIPGDPAAGTAADGAGAAVDDASAARIAELEATVAQQDAVISQLNGQLQALATVPSAPVTVSGERRIIGEDWSTKTTADAHAEGVKVTVMCSDGYYVPGG